MAPLRLSFTWYAYFQALIEWYCLKPQIFADFVNSANLQKLVVTNSFLDQWQALKIYEN